ncbi:aminoglycoside N(6')-acetyltransferase type 1 [Abditibacteriota bacterium]|nr:aminoglycoside N(6')-acetyltransferase type 1 [Abditibacteriota bacterium]
MISQNPQIEFRPVQLGDAPLLFHWRQQPHIAQWWNIAPYEAQTLDEVEEELREDLELNEHESFLILLDGCPIGYMQTYNAGDASGDWWPDEDESTAGLDLLIGEESLTGRGLGPVIVRAICDRLFEDLEVQSIIADPDPNNVRSVRCFEKAGFVAERQMGTPDGTALLMRLRREF